MRLVSETKNDQTNSQVWQHLNTIAKRKQWCDLYQVGRHILALQSLYDLTKKKVLYVDFSLSELSDDCLLGVEVSTGLEVSLFNGEKRFRDSTKSKK